MLTYLRYALATFCFAASVGWLALWGWGGSIEVTYLGPNLSTQVDSERGMVTIAVYETSPQRYEGKWRFIVHKMPTELWFADEIEKQGRFGQFLDILYFPLWYPALVFALTGVAALRLGPRFTLRSAIIATTVVAVLLGMAVGL